MMKMLKPENEAALAEMIATGTGPLRIVGGGTRDIGALVQGDVLSMAEVSGITLYEPGALTLVARAGTPVADIEAALASEGQRLAFEPMDHRGLLGTQGTPTIGGIVAANVSGPRRIQVGACRDSLLGVRFVDGIGRVLKNGGRVMKNVTGYDLVKLMAGSWGTLGVLSEVSLKVQALPETEATLVCEGKTEQDGVAALCAALGTPFDVAGAAHLDAAATGGMSRTQVRLEGLEASVAYRMDRLRQGLLAGFDVVQGAQSALLWDEVRNVTPFADQTGAVWRISSKPTDGPLITAALKASGLAHRAIYDWGGGLVWVLVTQEDTAGAAPIRQQVAKFGGHATLVRASQAQRAQLDVFQKEPTPIAAITTSLRAQFDPHGRLNPGLMGE